MAGTDVCTSSIFGLVTQLAKFLCHGEAYFDLNREYEPAAASANSDVSKRRIQIYEALLLGNGSGSLDKDGNGDVHKCSQQLDDPELVEMQKLIENQVDQQLGQKITQLLLSLSSPQGTLYENAGDSDQRTGINLRLLKPKPFKLEEQPPIEVMAIQPKTLKSVDFMRSQVDPLNFRLKSNLVSGDVDALRETMRKNAANAGTTNAAKLAHNVFQDSMSRIRDYKDRVRPICPRLPKIESLPSETKASCPGPNRGSNIFQESMSRINDYKEPTEKYGLDGYPKPDNIFKESMGRMKETNDFPTHEIAVYDSKQKVSPRSIQSDLSTLDTPLQTPRTGQKEIPWNDYSIDERRPEKCFISDLNITNDVKIFFNPQLELNYIKLPDLIEHLKYAAAGLQSETFVVDAQDRFHVSSDCTLGTLLPEVLTDFAAPFLESGGCYRRLTMRTKWLKPCLLERPLNRTLRKSIIIFLTTNRQFLLCQPAKELSQLLKTSRIPMQLMHNLETLFQNQPKLNLRTGTPGAFLISHIWSAIELCNNSKFLQLLIHLFKSICTTYYAQLENWLYRGKLDDTFNELFICRGPIGAGEIDERSKEFFDKGYQVKDEEVPGFLSGCQQAILQCGKYNQVLKAYKAQHPVLDCDYPSIVVCVSQEQVDNMCSNMQRSYAPILERYEKCSMQSIFEQRLASKQRFGNRMIERTQAHLDAWEKHQRQLLVEANIRSQKRCDELNAQLEEQKQHRLEQRRQEIARELAFQKECEQVEEQKLERENNTLLAKIAQLQVSENISNDDNQKEPCEADTEEIFSPDNSSSSDPSFVSCLEGPDTDQEATSATAPTAPQYQRSHSDVMNSNEEPTPTAISNSDVSRNRQHIMSSEQFQECQTQVELPSPADLNMNLKTLTTKDLSDLQRNRQRIMCHDGFAQFNSEEDTHSQRVKFQIESSSVLAQNRRRVMQSEFDIIMNQPEEKVSQKKRNETTYVQQNRYRMMESNFDIAIKSSEKNLNLSLDVNRLQVELPTPMSTTSDVEIEEKYVENSNEDQANNNYSILSEETESRIVTPIAVTPIEVTPIPNSLQEAVPTFHIPSNLGVPREARIEKKFKSSADATPTNPYMIRHCLQMSIMIPLNTHLSLLRSEIFRIFQELRIYDHFRQLRNYFFLLDGQFSMLLAQGVLGHINTGIEPRRLCQRGILDAVLNNAINAGETDDTAISQNLTLSCLQIPETIDLTSLDAFSILTLHSKIDWPLNLVISSETMKKYGEIFRHFFKLRQIDCVLQCSYEYLHEQGKLLGRRLCIAPHYRHLQMIRHKLSHFVTTLQNHLVSTALQAPWKVFKDEMRTADSIDTLYRQHVTYLKRVAFMALLNRHSSKIKETIDSILVIVLRFCKVLQTQPFALDADDQFFHPRYKRLVFEETEFNKFMHYLIYLGNKVATSGYQEEIGDLIRIINYNNYYKLPSEGGNKF